MGKRSQGAFARVERDFYPTPYESVLPLVPHIADEKTFVEPCAGDGSLIRAITAATNRSISCTGMYDIEPLAIGIKQQDALARTWGRALYITNPPWRRDILHPLILRLTENGGRAWLLFDADWMHTRQSAPYLPRLRKIVSVGRVKWIPDSKMTGKDNAAWYNFTAPSDEPARFYGRA